MAVKSLALSVPRVLRVNVEGFALDPVKLTQLKAAMTQVGFVERDAILSYRDTVIVDLRPPEEAILATFHGTARRHIRAIERKPVVVRVISDQSYAARLGSLLKESLERSGGSQWTEDWPTWIALAAKRPGLVRLIGMLSTEVEGPEGLWAFALGYHHGDHVEYGVAGSTRETGGLRLPLGYALAWDLIRWARNTGAQWFDFGGITAGSRGAGDPLRGISDFKRYFSREVVRVGAEWVYEPRPLRGAVARRIAALVRGRR
jgi:lipid II:glycine glycyltransferase (peptidoglycan interpeptide bridge formation enzyme)